MEKAEEYIPAGILREREAGAGARQEYD